MQVRYILLPTRGFTASEPYSAPATLRFLASLTPAAQTEQPPYLLVLDSIREGRVENVLDRKDTQESLAAVKELDLQWVNADSVHSDTSLLMNLRVTEGGAAVEGARLTFRFARPDAAPFYTQVATNSAGYAEMKVEMQEASLPDASVLVQASFGGRTATRKFRLRKID